MLLMRFVIGDEMYARIKLVTLLTALMACTLGAPLQGANLLVNGDFEDLDMNRATAVHSTIIGDGVNGLPVATGWTTSGYNFVFTNNPSYGGVSPTGADDYFDTAYVNASGDKGFALWGPDWALAPTANGLTNSTSGGNFLAADGAYLNRPIEQVVSGLEIGKTYSLSFEWAAAQQAQYPSGYDGITTEAWIVCFGTCSYTYNPSMPDSYAVFDNVVGEDTVVTTGERTNQSHGFVPWKYEYFEFTATAETQTLSLLAYGTPLGQPPFALIDGLQLQAVPEPTTWAMMLIGFGVIGGVMRTRRHSFDGRGAFGAQLV